MVRPITKISPIIRIAAPTPWRTNGSPARAIRRLSALACSVSLTSARPMTSPQVAEFHQCRIRLAGMVAPIGIAELVRDELVGRLGVRHAQERLGKAQQCDAFGGVQPIFLQELVHPARRLGSAELREHAERPILHPPQ
jgi:hypothetical protein